MALTNYTFSISSDTLNAVIYSPKLADQISQSNIIESLNRIDTDSDVLNIWFENVLTVEDSNTLTALVNSHDGVPYPEDTDPGRVIVENAVAVDKGTHSFDTFISHNWTDNLTWPATDQSTWSLEPSSGDMLTISKAEVQFTHDVKLSTLATPGELYFDIWVYNPLFDPQTAAVAELDDWYPGKPTEPIRNQLRFNYKRTVFDSIKRVFDYGNQHFTMKAAVDGITDGVTTVQFDYDQLIVLKSSEGGQIRICLKDDAPLEGTFCTISVVVREDVEV